jgi:hypothetical protein
MKSHLKLFAVRRRSRIPYGSREQHRKGRVCCYLISHLIKFLSLVIFTDCPVYSFYVCFMLRIYANNISSILSLSVVATPSIQNIRCTHISIFKFVIFDQKLLHYLWWLAFKFFVPIRLLH